MKMTLVKRLAPAVLALSVAGGGLGIGATTAFAAAKTTTTKPAAKTTTTKPAAKKSAPKAGAPCTKAQAGKTAKSGKVTLVCEKAGKGYKWEVKTAM
jgi:hypothetical protein